MSRNRVLLFFFAGLLAFCLSALEAIRARDDVRKLTAELYEARKEGDRLRDEHRSLSLEYETLADYGEIRARAEALGMREPSVRDGTLATLAREAAAAEEAGE